MVFILADNVLFHGQVLEEKIDGKKYKLLHNLIIMF